MKKKKKKAKKKKRSPECPAATAIPGSRRDDSGLSVQLRGATGSGSAGSTDATGGKEQARGDETEGTGNEEGPDTLSVIGVVVGMGVVIDVGGDDGEEDKVAHERHQRRYEGDHCHQRCRQ